MYLNVRLPLPVHSNPGYVLPPRCFRSAQDMARFAARMVSGILQHKEVLDRKELPVERAASREKGQPLCMAQYYRLLSSYRSPGADRDVLVSRLESRGEREGGRSTPPPPGEHVIVACKQKLYCLPVSSPGQGAASEDELTAELLAVMRDAASSPRCPPVGLLTAERRDTWAALRQHLYNDERNARSLKLIEKSLLMVCLDEPLPPSFNGPPRGGAGRDETNMAHQMIHGGGSAANSANRWFDLTVQLVVSPDGACGVCYEHSAAEGVAVVQLAEDVLRRVDATVAGVAGAAGAAAGVAAAEGGPARASRLDWAADQTVEHALRQAAVHIDTLVEDLDLYVYRYLEYGKNFIKSCRVSPDAYIQLSLQLAYYRMYRRLVATYESASTRRYLLGRVDCIRSATAEALAWAAAMCQDETGSEGDEESLLGKKVTFSLHTAEERLMLFEAAIKKQTEIMVDNITGQGIDVHLLGLREMARELGEPVPEIFKDEAYRTANHFGLSTSQVATSLESVMGYGPVVPDGYGASYNPKPDCIVFCLSAFKSCEHTSTARFARSLEESLGAMRQLLGARAP
ncbi:choline O-acetyltransferase [Bacillus rossius redtenbacheri]|uniref:choline O-acetyltransferase n=1 Tax=Bacillus rossius redtenbacheri TaxID=93214 RepID=UPI002FDC91EB